MKTLVKSTTSAQRSIPCSILKGTVVNLGLQALGGNLKKTDNIWPTLLVGAASGLCDYLGGNTAMAAALGGGNALINKTNFLGTTAKYAALGAFADLMLNAAEANAAEEPDFVNRTIDPHGYLKRKGVNYVHAHCTNIKEWTSEDAGSADYNLTSDKLEYKTLIAAFELAKRTKQVQSALQMFEDNANALHFIECDTIKGYSAYGISDVRIRTENGPAKKDTKNKEKCINNPDLCYCTLRVTLYAEEFSDMPVNKQIASMAITIGHELFIHKGLNVVESWKKGKYAEAWDMMCENRGEHGDYDHKLYIQGKIPRMTQYLAELKTAAPKANVGVTVYDIQSAIKEHDKKYLGLKYK